MDFPPEFIVSSSLKIGCVYKLTAPEMIETEVPHYFIVVAQHGENNFLLLSTTKIHKKFERYKDKESMDTIANIVPSELNGFTQSSFIDCNQHYEITVSQLVEKVENKKLQIIGNLSSAEFSNILYSMSISTTLDIPKFIIPKKL